MRKSLVTVTVVLLWLALSCGAFSQSSNATLGGTVSDATSALLPGVTVSATNIGTGVVTSVVSNETGAYQFPPLQPGTYKASAELPGFQTQIYNNVVLGISQQVRLNFTLQVASQAQAVEVNVAADTLIATTSASVGTVLPEYKVRDLPLGDRDITDLINAMPGVQGTSNVAGAPTGFTMTTRDGIPVNQGRYNPGAFSQTAVSPDLIDEVRIIIAPADAEYGRGSAQLQMSTRSGTNDFRGALFWSNRNSVWDANTFSNNFNRVGKNYLNRNQFGGRIGGPIVRNKTFFFTLIEAQRAVEKSIIFPVVLTQQARQGIFRYFPGAANAGATAAVPTVDLAGNPVRPAAATGDLQLFNVFGRDPLRMVPDQSGLIKRTVLDVMPLPNNFEAFAGVDGLNTARYQWSRRRFGNDGLNGGSGGDFSNRTQVNVRFDHNFNDRNRLSVAATREQSFADLSLSEWPGGFNGQIQHHPRVYTASFVSTLTSSLVNEVRLGMRRGRLEALQAFDHPKTGLEARKFMGASGAIPWTIEGTLFGQSSMIYADNGSIGNATPLWNYGDSISWVRGKHAFKVGADFRYQRGNAWNSDEIVPAVHLGPSDWPGPNGAFPFGGPGGTVAREYYCFACGITVTNLDVANMNATDNIRAKALLTDLAGSVANISQAFSLRPDPKNLNWLDYSQYYQKYRDFHQNEFSWFFKDDWKVRPDLTLNLGVRWEWFGVPYEGNGLMAAPVDGNPFGLSGNSFADWMKPGIRGQLTTMEFVGKHSPQPDKKLYQDDYNNFAPAVGFSWSLPWLGKDKTVLRAGYGIAYGGRFAAGGGLGVDLFIGLAPSTNQFAWHPITEASQVDLRNVAIPIPERNPDGRLPVIQVTERNQSLAVYDRNTVIPYIQNLNVELQREIVKNLTVEVRYIASKGTKLESTLHLNNPIIEENGLLDAFKLTQAGGDSPLFNQIFMGLNVPGVGLVNGTTLTGSQAVRQFAGTRTFLANNQVRDFANFLNTNSSLTGQTGGLLRRAGLPENFIVTNPQFGGTTFGIAGAGIVANIFNSTYHSMQTSVTKRLSQGFTNQTTYTWSRSIGTSVNDFRYRNNKSLQAFQRTHDIRSNGTVELPFGPNRRLLGNAPGWVSRLVERWQFGGIFSWTSGAPLSFAAGPSPFVILGNSTNYPDLVGAFPKSSGEVKVTGTPGRITYFDGFTRVADPGRSNITDAQNLRSFATVNFALQDPQGNIVMRNPATGKIGNMGQNWIEGPGVYRLDANLIKRVKIAETKEFELRLDAVNILNHPVFGNPNTDINSVNFGVIGLPTTGNRTFTFATRVNF